MKVTTVRFGEDLWALLEDEAARAGVSVSQYIREAALARAAFAAGARADAPPAVLANWSRRTLDASVDDEDKRRSATRLIAALDAGQARRDAAAATPPVGLAEETAALQAQARQTARRARELRRSSRELE